MSIPHNYNIVHDEESIRNDDIDITNDSIIFTDTPIIIDGMFNRVNITGRTGTVSTQRNSRLITCIMCNCLGFLLLVIFFIPFYDIYCGFSDESCLKFNPSSKIKISLGTFLKVEGILYCFMIWMSIRNTMCGNRHNCLIITYNYYLFYIIVLFLFSWNIVGGIIFWKEIDNTQCSHALYLYVFYSLIFKYMGYFISCCCN